MLNILWLLFCINQKIQMQIMDSMSKFINKSKYIEMSPSSLQTVPHWVTCLESWASWGCVSHPPHSRALRGCQFVHTTAVSTHIREEYYYSRRLTWCMEMIWNKVKMNTVYYLCSSQLHVKVQLPHRLQYASLTKKFNPNAEIVGSASLTV